MRRLARILGTLLIVGGVGTLGWAVLVWQWQDPFTAVYTKYEQHKLSGQYKRIVRDYKYAPVAAAKPGTTATTKATARAIRPMERDYKPMRETQTPSLAEQRRQIARESRAYRRRLQEGQPFGRLKVPRLGLSIVMVNGTEGGTLTKGPGRYTGSFLPGEGELIYVAGHRTTYGAPFAHIDRMRPGDRATVELPYATFEYVATRHVIVEGDDLSVLRSNHHELLALQACHPRFFASQRYIVYMKLVRVTPRNGPGYAVAGTRLIPA